MKKLSKERIVIVEPSPFRRDETYVLGPYGRIRAYLVGWWETKKNPFSLVMIYPAQSTVSIGERQLWPKN